EVLKFINDFGFCEMPHLDARFGFKKPRNYQVMQRLIDAKLVKHERVFYGRHGIYRLSRAGSRYTDLPPLARVPLGSYQHEVTLINVYLKLATLYPDATWLSERRLKRDKYFDGVGKRGHLSDGMLILPDGKSIAVEVELSLKGKNRLESILKGYGSEFSIKEVWYYCSDGVAASMASMVTSMPFVKVHRLREFLHES
ncbi:MAG: hypothetical protein ACNA7Y_01315, partial [Gammaproteobacteria bacterium]